MNLSVCHLVLIPAVSSFSSDTDCLILAGQVGAPAVLVVVGPDGAGVGAEEELGAARGRQVGVAAAVLGHLR